MPQCVWQSEHVNRITADREAWTPQILQTPEHAAVSRGPMVVPLQIRSRVRASLCGNSITLTSVERSYLGNFRAVQTNTIKVMMG